MASRKSIPCHPRLIAFLLGTLYLIGLPPDASATESTSSISSHWDLLNGPVKLTEPIRLQFRDRLAKRNRSVTLEKPQLVRAGAGGAVFAFDQQAPGTDDGMSFTERDLLLKISWEGTAKTVKRECATLQLLGDRQVKAAERCLGSFDYPDSDQDTEPRTMILVTLYMRDAVASVMEVDTETARRAAVDHIVRTLVQMLAANVITIDVQPLISKSSGRTIFIE